MKLVCNKANPFLGGLIAVEYLNSRDEKKIVEVEWSDETSINDVTCANENDLLRLMARLLAENELYGTEPIEKTQVDGWLTLTLTQLISKFDFQNALGILNKALAVTTYLACKRLTIADFAVFSALYSSNSWKVAVDSNSAPINVLRWYKFIESQPFLTNTFKKLPEGLEAKLISLSSGRQSTERSTVGNRAREGKFIDLPGAEMGKVVVRFPPEASGYLHIGHAKAALLNQYYQEAFEGKLIMRFDDTNPAKENVDFEKVILEDVEMLEIKPDMFTHTSQYFDLMLELCEKLLKEGNAYVDDTDAEQMKIERELKTESANRKNSYERNKTLWEEMMKGTQKGQKCCVRAKIDMQSPNGCMRDPTIYRCKNEPHPRTGSKYKVYPTYDFACPIVDSIEGVTHVLRTMEYHDRDPQFFWFIDALGLRKPHIWEYSRLSMTNTVLSKRKLTWFVQERLVDGWDDPRMPTVRGVLRRGMTVQGLKEFIIAQGSSRSVVFMEWDKIWAFNKKVIDPIAPRYMALEYENRPVVVSVKGAKEECLTVLKHPKNPEIGTKPVWVGPKILIDRVDAELLKEGENATFINWGNLLIKKINRQNGLVSDIEAEPNLDNKDYKKTLKLTWLVDTEKAKFTPTWCVYFDHIISKPLLGKDEDFKQFIGHQTRKEIEMLGESEMKNLKKGDIIQLQRRGFFKVDVAYEPMSLYSCKEQAVILFYVPDGHVKEIPLGGGGVVQPAVSVKKPEPASAPVEKVKSVEVGSKSASSINEEILKQGEVVRNLKSQKAAKADIEGAVKILLSLKADYKTVSGSEWKPGCVPLMSTAQITSSPSVTSADDINAKISSQGDLVRKLKSEKAEKSSVESAVKILLDLKGQYKNLTGIEWKPANSQPVQKIQETCNQSEGEILAKITSQGDVIRKLKSEKAPKDSITKEVEVLLRLKADFKVVSGKDWTQNMSSTPQATVSGDSGSIKNDLVAKVTKQGDLVRELKANKSAKGDIDAAVKELLNLKAEYKKVTGEDFPAPSGGKPAAKSKETKKSQKEKTPPIKEKKFTDTEDSTVKKQTRLGLEAKKEENLSDWYSQVITKGEMIEYYDVSGCYIFRPWSFAIWEAIRDWFDSEIKKLGVQNCYFPIFVSKSVLEKEKTHISDFAPEVAWVTRSGDTEMAEPIAVRPTSETVMYPAYAKWIQSYRDLPIKLNQWNNVVRWEFKHPQPFLRTREFLWQEGHSAYALKKEADVEVKTILDLYARIYTDLLAIPVVKGRKTEKEKFAGGDYTLTVEAFVSASGRAIQGATSHHLGQNFSKMFDIIYEDPDTQDKKYVYQNSWGITTRTIGVMIMIHADNQGLVLPPKVASIQIVLVPCGITASLSEEGREKLQKSCDHLEHQLKSVGIRVKGDYRSNYSPGWKFNHWELKGVPIRVELGPKDIEKNQLIAVRRDTGEKIIIARPVAAATLADLLEKIQTNLLSKATIDLTTHTVKLDDWSKFTANLDAKNIILAPFCGETSCEDQIKNDSTRDDSEAEAGAPSMGAKSLCIPLEQPEAIGGNHKCVHPNCKNKPKFYTLFGRSY